LGFDWFDHLLFYQKFPAYAFSIYLKMRLERLAKEIFFQQKNQVSNSLGTIISLKIKEYPRMKISSFARRKVQPKKGLTFQPYKMNA